MYPIIGPQAENGSEYIEKLVDAATSIRDKSLRTTTTERLSASECLEAYKTQYVSSRGDVLIVQNEVVSPTTIIVKPHYWGDGSYIDGAPVVADQVPPSSKLQPPNFYPAIKILPYLSEPSSYPSNVW